MNVEDTIERMTLDLMVKGTIDQKELRPSLNELTRALSGVEDIAQLLSQLDKTIKVPRDSAEIDRKFQEALQILEEISSRVKKHQQSAKKNDLEIPSHLLYNGEVDAAVIESFQLEVADISEKLEHDLLLLERSPDSEEMITAAMGHLHSIKGIAGFLDFVAIQKLAHIAESALSIGLAKKIVSSQVCDALLRTRDMCDSLVQMFSGHLRNKGRRFPKLPPTYPLLFKELWKLSNDGDEITKPSTRSHSSKSLAESAAMEATSLSISGGHMAADIAIDEKESSLNAEADIEYEEYTQEDLENVFGNLIFEAEEAAKNELGHHKNGDDGANEPNREVPMGQAHIFDSSENVRIKLSRLDSLLDIMGELVIAHSQVVHDPVVSGIYDLDLERKLEHLTKCTRELQALGMSMRVFPVKQLFAPLGRTVRDLAVKLNKDVDVVRVGEDAELDKSVLQALSDPLIHMVRNSVDHGIESRQERKKLDKRQRATIRLSAQSGAGLVRIGVEDDGRGLDRKRILEKAISMDLVKEENELSDEAVWNLIFAPGFSTSAEVSEVSGRGVGMDVVQRSIHRLGGRIHVESFPGKGTKFILTLPLTLAMIDGLMVEVGTKTYIIPHSSIGEIIRPNRDQINTVHGRGEILSIRGNAMPLVRLHEFLNIKGHKIEPWNALSLVIRNANSPFALMVDNVSGQHQVVLKSLGAAFANQQGISGCAILGDGRVGLVLNPEEIHSFVMNTTVHEVS